MASSRYENMWGLMSLHTFIQDPDTINDNLSCVICNNLMIDACHSTCGCQYCHKCISDYLRDGDRYCPGDKDACKEELLVLDRDIYRNRGLNIKISNMKVLCPNKSCLLKVELIKMEEHMRMCTKQSISCPYNTLGCDEDKGPRDTIVAHLYDGMMTHSTKLIEWIIDVKNEIDNLKNKAQVTELEMSAMKEELRMKNLEIINLNEEMTNTKEILENRIVTLERESTDNSERIVNLEKLFTDNKNIMATLVRESEDSKAKTGDLGQRISIINDDSGAGREELSDVKDSSATFEGPSGQYRKEVRPGLSATKEGTDERERREKVALSVDQSRSKEDGSRTMVGGASAAIGAMTVTVDRLSYRRMKEDIFSPYFYSHNNGYKLRLIITPLILYGLYNTDVSLVICEGEYDALLQWPCEYSFDISIVDQRNGGTAQNVTVNYASIGDRGKYLFNKPSNKDNNKYKCATFNPLLLKGAIVNDSIIIKCIVRS